MPEVKKILPTHADEKLFALVEFEATLRKVHETLDKHKGNATAEGVLVPLPDWAAVTGTVDVLCHSVLDLIDGVKSESDAMRLILDELKELACVSPVQPEEDTSNYTQAEGGEEPGHGLMRTADGILIETSDFGGKAGQ